MTIVFILEKNTDILVHKVTAVHTVMNLPRTGKENVAPCKRINPSVTEKRNVAGEIYIYLSKRVIVRLSPYKMLLFPYTC